MEKLHHLGLLFLNFGVLNILLSLIFFLISAVAKRFISSPHTKSRLFFLSLVAPPALSAFTILTSFAPPLFVKIPGKAMFCLNVPYCYIFSFISPDGIPLFDGLLISAVGLTLMPIVYFITNIGSSIKVYTTLHKLDSPPHHPFLEERHIDKDVLKELKGLEDSHGIRVKVIDTPYILSFVWGYLSNILVLSTGVLKTLSIDELRGLLRHELAHCERQDNILKGILLLCRNSLFIFPHVYYLLRWWKDEIELIGDEAAARSTGRPLDVAMALLKMVTPSSQANPPLNPSFSPFKKEGLRGIWGMGDWPYPTGFSMTQNERFFTVRVERLVAINDGKIRVEKERWHLMPSERGLLISTTSLFPLFFIAIAEFNPLLVHCFLEKLFSIF